MATCLFCKRILLSLQELIIMGTYMIMSFEINCCPQLHSPSEFQAIPKLKHTCLFTSPTLGGRGFTSNGSLRLFKCNVNVYFFTLYFFWSFKCFIVTMHVHATSSFMNYKFSKMLMHKKIMANLVALSSKDWL